MSFDDDAGQLVIVNIFNYGRRNALEIFDFDLETGLTPAGYCEISSTRLGYGVAVVEDGDPTPGTFTAYVSDAGDFAAPVEIDEY
jgi:hypothetical protein